MRKLDKLLFKLTEFLQLSSQVVPALYSHKLAHKKAIERQKERLNNLQLKLKSDQKLDEISMENGQMNETNEKPNHKSVIQAFSKALTCFQEFVHRNLNLIQLLTPMLLQDGPFLIVRLLLVSYYKVKGKDVKINKKTCKHENSHKVFFLLTYMSHKQNIKHYLIIQLFLQSSQFKYLQVVAHSYFLPLKTLYLSRYKSIEYVFFAVDRRRMNTIYSTKMKSLDCVMCKLLKNQFKRPLTPSGWCPDFRKRKRKVYQVRLDHGNGRDEFIRHYIEVISQLRNFLKVRFVII